MRTNFKFQILNFKTTVGIFILGFLIFPLFANAVLIEGNNTEVINEINVSASTGDNKIEGGENGQVIEGEPKSSVDIKTIINGEEVESISTESSEGSIRVESRVEVNEQGVVNPAEGEARQGRQELRIETTVKNWWLNFVENLKTIFLGIFNIF